MRLHWFLALALPACGPAADAPTRPPLPADQPVTVALANRSASALDSVLLDFSSFDDAPLGGLRCDTVPSGAMRSAQIRVIADRGIRLVLQMYGPSRNFLPEHVYVVRNPGRTTTTLVLTLADSAGGIWATLRDQTARLHRERVGEQPSVQRFPRKRNALFPLR